MENSKKLIILIGAIVLIAAVYFLFNPKSFTPSSEINNEQQSNVMPTATGDVDQVISSLIDDATNEQSTTTNYDESSLSNLDSTELTNLIQTYDENQF